MKILIFLLLTIQAQANCLYDWQCGPIELCYKKSISEGFCNSAFTFSSPLVKLRRMDFFTPTTDKKCFTSLHCGMNESCNTETKHCEK